MATERRAQNRSVVERRAAILNILERAPERTLENEALARFLNVSAATIRRDVASLEEEHLVVRSHGHVHLFSSPTAKISKVKNEHISQKRAIASRAIRFLRDESLLILDAGTTAEQVAIALDNKFHLTVFTNGIRPMHELANQSNVQTIVLGGALHPTTDMICGPTAEQMLQNVRGDYAFLGAQNLNAARGIASLSFEQARLKSLMMQHAERVFILADASKFRQPVEQFWSPFPPKWTLITTNEASLHTLQQMRNSGASEVIVVD